MADGFSLGDLLSAVPPGSARRQSVSWNPRRWLARRELAPWHHVIESLAEVGDIPRSEVRRYAEGDPTNLLIASMVWGYGPLSYGPARVAEMVAGSRTGEPIRTVLETMRTEVRRSPASGFTAVFWRREPKLRRLGTSYATKYLHFAEHGRGRQRALVYDKRVWRTLQQLSDFPGKAPDPGGRVWSTDYAGWCDWAATASAEQGCTPEDIEYAAFCANGSVLLAGLP